MKIKVKILILSILLIPISLTLLYYNPDHFVSKKIKYYVSPTLKQDVKDFVFYLPEMKKKLDYLDQKIDLLEKETGHLKQENNILKIDKIKNNTLDIWGSKRKLDIYGVTSFKIPFHNYKSSKKASFYLSILGEFVYLVSGTGQILRIDKENLNKDKIKPVFIKNNIVDLIKDPKHFDIFKNIPISGQISIKDSKIINKKLFLSYNKEVSKDCYNTSIISAELNASYLIFEEFFTYDECILREIKGKKTWFWGQQSGGRIIQINNQTILFSIGEYRARSLAQDDNSIFGKIIEINIFTKKFSVFSKGHRNPQGLVYIESKNKIVSTEHGPYGGDEVNVIKKGNNYGWPISSYGRHYDNTFKKESPLYKSHKKYGFIEPVFHWSKVSSVGVSQIVHLGEDKDENDIFLVGSMRARKLFFFNINKNYSKANLFKTINIKERVRDVIYDKDTDSIFLSLENTPKLVVMKLDPPEYF
ncbi:PQQ-dependent sugar dehydrogenase [bacterium]|nr:PQQ-dependent sugar dehydrogenase [bacterium]